MARDIFEQVFSAVGGCLPAAATPGWQPIETAPKNGTAVLGWDKDEGHYVTWCSEGSWGQSVDDCVYLQFPTHWRPLPPPPEV
jgi:hypothetical protein